MTLIAVGKSDTIQRSINGGVSWATVTSPFTTANWISAVGYGNGRFYLGGESRGEAYSTDDGVSFTQTTDNNNYPPYQSSIASDGSTDVVIGGFEDVQEGVRFSTDTGASFAFVTGMPSAVTYGAFDVIHDGTRFIMGSYAGDILTSTDGDNWTLEDNIGVSGSVRGLAYDSINALYIAVVQAGTSFTIHSAADVTATTPWTQRHSATTTLQLNNHPIHSQAGTTIIADRDGVFYRSTNGTSWATVTHGGTGGPQDIAYDTGLWSSYSDAGEIYTSADDGITWTARTSAHGATGILGAFGSAPSPAGRTIIAVGIGGRIQKSTDCGNTWASKTAPDSEQYHNARGDESGDWVISARTTVSESGDDGETWTARTLTGATSTNKHAVEYSGSEWLVGGTDRVWRSTDRITWTAHSTNGSSELIKAIFWDGDQFIAGTDARRIETSTDGQSWTTQGFIASGGSYECRDILYNSTVSLYFAVTTGTLAGGSGLAVYASEDLARWSEIFFIETGGPPEGALAQESGVMIAARFLTGGNIAEGTGSADWATNTNPSSSLVALQEAEVDDATAAWIVFDDNGFVSTSLDRVTWSYITSAHTGGTNYIIGAGAARDPLPAKPTPATETQLFSNNAETTLAAAATSSATSLTVTNGSLFSIPATNQYELLTISAGTNVEIVKMTARSGNTLTVVRGHELTIPRAWAIGDAIAGRVTAGTLKALQ